LGERAHQPCLGTQLIGGINRFRSNRPTLRAAGLATFSYAPARLGVGCFSAASALMQHEVDHLQTLWPRPGPRRIEARCVPRVSQTAAA